MTIKKFQSLIVLAKSQMIHIKGGRRMHMMNNANTEAFSNSASSINSVDDKRRERPGGGITTI